MSGLRELVMAHTGDLRRCAHLIEPIFPASASEMCKSADALEAATAATNTGFDSWWRSFPATSSEHPDTMDDRSFAKAAWDAAAIAKATGETP